MKRGSTVDVTQAKIDDTDWRILAELQRDGRLSYKSSAGAYPLR